MAFCKISLAAAIFLLLMSHVYPYKKDHGFGYLFKHDPNRTEREDAEKKTNDMIRNTLIGTASSNGNETTTVFPEPFLLPDLQTKYSGTTMQFTGMRVYGLDRYRPLNIKTDYTNLAVSLSLSLSEVSVLGEFQMFPWVVDSTGTFKFIIDDMWITLEAELMLTNEGTDNEALAVSDVRILELSNQGLQLKFGNLGFLGTILQPVRSSLAQYVFSKVKPTLIGEAELNFRRIMNNVLANLPKECVKAVNIVDKAIIRARKLMKTSQLDPVLLADQYPKSTPVVKLELTEGKLYGLSGLKRTGPILFGFERDAVHMMLNLEAVNIKGQYAWTLTLWKNLLTHRGILQFDVQDIVIKVKLEKRTNSQESKTRVESINMKIGSVNLRSEGVGAMKYIMETFLNVVPDSFRQRITEAADYRLLKLIEEEAEKIDLEELVEDSEEFRRRR